ncbi:MAG: hypothetical protein AAGH88_03390 [Planctomycetota bacterium]
MTKLRFILVNLSSTALLGCSWQRPDGSHRHLVLGIGLVDVDQSSGRVLPDELQVVTGRSFRFL